MTFDVPQTRAEAMPAFQCRISQGPHNCAEIGCVGARVLLQMNIFGPASVVQCGETTSVSFNFQSLDTHKEAQDGPLVFTERL